MPFICLSVPPLEGFVMNRVLGDYLETLLYKIFVSIDEHTPISEVIFLTLVNSFELPAFCRPYDKQLRVGCDVESYY